MDFGTLNFGQDLLNEGALGNIIQQTNLGEQVLSSLKMVTWIEKVVKNSYGMFAFIRQGTTCYM